MHRLMTVTLTITIAPDAPAETPSPAEGQTPAATTHPDPPESSLWPWEQPVSPAVAACPLCDRHGFVDLVDAHGNGLVLTCGHDRAHLEALVAAQGYQLVRQDRSRDPPPPPAGGAP